VLDRIKKPIQSIGKLVKLFDGVGVPATGHPIIIAANTGGLSAMVAIAPIPAPTTRHPDI
jgi:hypothetical protein